MPGWRTGPARAGLHIRRLGSEPEKGLSLAGYRLSGGRHDFPETAVWIGEVIARQLDPARSSVTFLHRRLSYQEAARVRRRDTRGPAAYLIEDDTMEDPRCKHG